MDTKFIIYWDLVIYFFNIVIANFRGKERIDNKQKWILQVAMPIIALGVLVLGVMFLLVTGIYNPNTVESFWTEETINLIFVNLDFAVSIVKAVVIENVIFFFLFYILFDLLFKRTDKVDFRKIVFSSSIFSLIHLTNFNPMIEAIPLLVLFIPISLVIGYMTERFGFMSGLFQQFLYNFIIISTALV